MQELQGKIKELNDTNKQMAQAEGVDRKEFSDIQTELGELGGRWSALIQHSKEENQRYEANNFKETFIVCFLRCINLRFLNNFCCLLHLEFLS
jgi:hypothetical protein